MLLEELLPLSRLALFLKRPGLSVIVESYENNGNADGHIWITGFLEREFDIQVTCTQTYEESLRRELLNRTGFCPGAGPIWREKISKLVHAEPQGIDSGSHIQQTAFQVVEQFRKKSMKPYSPGTVLVIGFDEIHIYGHNQWDILVHAVGESGLSNSQFAEVYLFNAATNELLRVA